MKRGAENYYKALIKEGHQRSMIDQMQTREELYQYLNYHQFEHKLDQLFSENKEK